MKNSKLIGKLKVNSKEYYSLILILFSVTEQEQLYRRDNKTKYEKIQFKISQVRSIVKDKQNALLKKIGIG